MKEKTNCIYRFNGFQLEIDEGVLKKGGEIIHLTPKAFDTLVVLLENKGKMVEKEYLLNEVWANTFVGEETLAQNISTLRKTLGLMEDGKPMIETVYRRGYKFVGEVSKIVDRENLQVAETVSENQKSSILKSDGQNHLRFLSTALLAVILILSSIALVLYFQKQNPENSSSAPVSSIAVLPFQTVGERNSEEKIGFGMADAIITRLSKLQKIPVRPTSAVFRFSDKPASSAVAAGRDLGVDTVLEGTIQRDGERFRVTVRLINVAEGKPLWAETIDERESDIFSLQDSISNKIAQSLTLKLTPEQKKILTERPTNDPGAFEAYQMGVYFWNTRTQENLQKARTYFEKAIELDPQFAEAYAMLADTLNLIGYYSLSNRDELYKEVSINAAKALTLDNSVAAAYLALASVHLYENDLAAAEDYLENAVEREPYNSTVHVRYAWVLLRLGKTDKAVSEMRFAQEYDPLSPVSNGALCNLLTYQENFAEAVKVCQKAVELSPNTADNRLALANALFFNGNVEEAIKQAQIDAAQGEEKDSALGNIGYFYARSGRRAEAETIFNRLKANAEKQNELFKDLTLIGYALGRKDEAFKYFKRAYEKKVLSVLLFNRDPVWKEIRQDARFAELMEER
ncbi:MAG: tetratricopeptide repeat protein [Pyrinomonadaceae bacterium]|nr:tetratricopeptide repeat protein [Pyrinomonadaceae bacterium]